jgi:hypothetical protein
MLKITRDAKMHWCLTDAAFQKPDLVLGRGKSVAEF